jgi:hypothetical protein
VEAAVDVPRLDRARAMPLCLELPGALGPQAAATGADILAVACPYCLQYSRTR